MQGCVVETTDDGLNELNARLDSHHQSDREVESGSLYLKVGDKMISEIHERMVM